MTAVLRGVRPIDGVLVGVLCALGAALMVINIVVVDPATRVDSRSWLSLPVFLLATVPALWWRRSLVLSTLVAATVMSVHDLAFGGLVRCGAGLPLAFVFTFLCGVSCSGLAAVVGLGLSGVLAAAVLVLDTAAGPELIPTVLLVQVVLFAVGRLARSHAAISDELRRRTDELMSLRDHRAAREVASTRARVSDELDQLLDRRLGHLETVAATGADEEDSAGMRRLLEVLEEEGRRTLQEVRSVVGQLRGADDPISPTPSVAQLDALLARHGCPQVLLRGSPRALPASLELSAYRIVEHVLAVLGDSSPAQVRVMLRFCTDALEIELSGPLRVSADLRAALGPARERVRLHAGSLDARVEGGQARVLARLPGLGG